MPPSGSLAGFSGVTHLAYPRTGLLPSGETCSGLLKCKDRVRYMYLKFTRSLKFAMYKTIGNSMKKMMLCLNLVYFSSKGIDLLYIQQIPPQFIIFISIFTWGKFQTCDEFQISYYVYVMIKQKYFSKLVQCLVQYNNIVYLQRCFYQE